LDPTWTSSDSNPPLPDFHHICWLWPFLHPLDLFLVRGHLDRIRQLQKKSNNDRVFNRYQPDRATIPVPAKLFPRT
jgi:hypothetical protein